MVEVCEECHEESDLLDDDLICWECRTANADDALERMKELWDEGEA